MAQLQKRRLAQSDSFKLPDHQAVDQCDKTEDPFGMHAEDSNHNVQVDSIIAMGEEWRGTEDESDTKPPLPNAAGSERTSSVTMRALMKSIQYQEFKEDKL
ncbi:hypothetical protein THAOC_26848, partial [Thalassiosira oceanica]